MLFLSVTAGTCLLLLQLSFTLSLLLGTSTPQLLALQKCPVVLLHCIVRGIRGVKIDESKALGFSIFILQSRNFKAAN